MANVEPAGAELAGEVPTERDLLQAQCVGKAKPPTATAGDAREQLPNRPAMIGTGNLVFVRKLRWPASLKQRDVHATPVQFDAEVPRPRFDAAREMTEIR